MNANEAAEPFENVLTYIFAEYSQHTPGLMSRKEFFTFLWELKQSAKQVLNEGQMMSCWLQVSHRKDEIDEREFKEGLEVCYDHQFFARENGAEAPVFNLGNGEDPASYNTVKFKKSMGVAAFNKILEDEQTKREEKQVRPMTLYGGKRAAPPPTVPRSSGTYVARPSIPTTSTTSDAPDEEDMDNNMDEERVVERTERTERIRTSTLPSTNNSAPTGPPTSSLPSAPVTNFHTKMLQIQKEREQKKIEAQKKMDQILSQRYQDQKKAREEERQRAEQQKLNQRQQEAESIIAEPAWMQALKNKKTTTGVSRY